MERGYRNLPGVTIDAIETDPDAIALRDVFRIPADDARFKMARADGTKYVTRKDAHTDPGMRTACAPGNRRPGGSRTQSALRFTRLPSALFVL